MFNVWPVNLNASTVLFAGAGMAVTSVAMSLGRATIAPRRNEPDDLREINAMIDAHFSDAYTNPPPRTSQPQSSYSGDGFSYSPPDQQDYDHDSHVGPHPDGPAMLPDPPGYDWRRFHPEEAV